MADDSYVVVVEGTAQQGPSVYSEFLFSRSEAIRMASALSSQSGHRKYRVAKLVFIDEEDVIDREFEE